MSTASGTLGNALQSGLCGKAGQSLRRLIQRLLKPSGSPILPCEVSEGVDALGDLEQRLGYLGLHSPFEPMSTRAELESLEDADAFREVTDGQDFRVASKFLVRAVIAPSHQREVEPEGGRGEVDVVALLHEGGTEGAVYGLLGRGIEVMLVGGGVFV